MMLLINDEEVLTMLENMIEANDVLEETPLMRRLRSQGREERSRHDILKIKVTLHSNLILEFKVTLKELFVKHF